MEQAMSAVISAQIELCLSDQRLVWSLALFVGGRRAISILAGDQSQCRSYGVIMHQTFRSCPIILPRAAVNYMKRQGLSMRRLVRISTHAIQADLRHV
jgi:hypothetical protein